jgi:hypothetical protein
MNNPTTLRVKFPSWPGWHVPEFSLTSLPPAPGHDSAQRITVSVAESVSDYCSDSPVFLGSIEGTEAPVFALKFAMREDLVYDLEEESRIYRDALQALQGTAIPRCFGIYTGLGEEGQTIACLVLEYWGECLQQPFQVLLFIFILL